MPRRLLSVCAPAARPAFTVFVSTMFTCALVAFPSMAAAQDATTPPSDLDVAMQAWERSAQPGPWHAFLAQRAGKWNVAGRIWNDPEGEPSLSSGESKLELVLGGRFLQERHKGRKGEIEYTGLGLLGFDNADSTVTAVWYDDLGTRTSVLTGRAGSPGQPVELRGAMTDPASGRRLALRVVLTWVGANEQRWDYYGAPEGFDEARLMELTYTRRR